MHTKSVNPLFHLFHDLFMNSVTEILNGALPLAQDHRGRVVWSSLTWLGVDTDEIEVLPHPLDQLINVEPIL